MRTTLPILAVLTLCVLPAHAARQTSTPAAPPPGFAAEPAKVQTGVTSWYGGRWIGRLTANGETYKKSDMTAAHRSLPFGTMVRVVDERTGRSTVVRINNRGPYVKGRILDLSDAAASDLGIKNRGVARVRLEILRKLSDEELRLAENESNDGFPGRLESWYQPRVGANTVDN